MSTSKKQKAEIKPPETDILDPSLPENPTLLPEDDSSVKPPEDPLPDGTVITDGTKAFNMINGEKVEILPEETDLPVAPIPDVVPPTPVVQETKVPQDYNSALLMMADATRILQDKESLSRTLEAKNVALQVEVDKKEANRNELDADLEKKRIELENINQKIDDEKIAQGIGNDTRAKELDVREAAIKAREDAIELSIVEAERVRSESQRMKEENEKAQADIDSKLAEAQHLSSQRKSEIIALEEKRQEAEMATLRMETQRSEITEESNRVNAESARLKESREDAETLHNSIQEDRKKLEQDKLDARTENNSAEYNKNMAKLLTEAFRQELHRYVQITGTEIKIPELTDAHKVWLAEDLMKQVNGN